MRRIATLGELQAPPLPRGIREALRSALLGEYEIAGAQYDHDGSIWLLEPTDTDTDRTFVKTFGVPLKKLPFEFVRHHPDGAEGAYFLAYLVRNNSSCDTLLIPDACWLDPEWRAWLTSQI